MGLTLGSLCAPPASAQSGRPGGGHYRQISYAQSGNWSDDIRDVPSPIRRLWRVTA